ncbi:hypothetical protein KP509_26G070400 [Ceratopteris richardii]|uniref:Transmembrane protein n=1 Tax=Ceratopteris richardii TaxID=49495 RepID=A0A8T2RLS6_CERRI|nr:hypothetical protein KP509_26G070400 [Ceratopteris richardii]
MYVLTCTRVSMIFVGRRWRFFRERLVMKWLYIANSRSIKRVMHFGYLCISDRVHFSCRRSFPLLLFSFLFAAIVVAYLKHGKGACVILVEIIVIMECRSKLMHG